jgi:hypothetical protein
VVNKRELLKDLAWYAIRARLPQDIHHPPTIDSLINDAHFAANHGLYDASATALGGWHLAIAKMYEINEVKSKHVCRSNWWFFRSIVALSLPLLMVITMLVFSCPITYPLPAPPAATSAPLCPAK